MKQNMYKMIPVAHSRLLWENFLYYFTALLTALLIPFPIIHLPAIGFTYV